MNITSGIYKITNLINNKIYVGSTKFFNIRKTEHYSRLRLNSHCNIKLQRSFNKYGEQNFKFEILETCIESNLIFREQFYIDTLKPEFNICKIAGRLSIPRTDDWNRKISESNMGKKASKETRLKQSLIKLGKPPSNKGIKHSEITKQKIKDSISKINRVAWNKGLPCREETKLKISFKIKGRVQSIEEKNKRSESLIGKKNKAVICLDLEGNIINEFPSITIAIKNTNIKGIANVLTGLSKTSGGYNWKYKNEEVECA